MIGNYIEMFINTGCTEFDRKTKLIQLGEFKGPTQYSRIIPPRFQKGLYEPQVQETVLSSFHNLPAKIFNMIQKHGDNKELQLYKFFTVKTNCQLNYEEECYGYILTEMNDELITFVCQVDVEHAEAVINECKNFVSVKSTLLNPIIYSGTMNTKNKNQ